MGQTLTARVDRALRRYAAGLPPSLRGRLQTLRLALDPEHRRSERQRWQELRAFAARNAALFADLRSPPPGGKTLLVATGGLPSAIQVELVLVKRLQMAGFTPVVLGWRSAWAREYYAGWGMDRYECWEDLFPRGGAELPELRSFEDVLAFEHAGARVGKYAASATMRRTRAASLDPGMGAAWSALLEQLGQGFLFAHAARRALERQRPEAVLFLEHGYSPWGELFDLSIARGVDVLQWNGCHKDNALMLKRYNAGNAHMHPASLSQDTWRRLRRMPWGPADAERVRRELFDNYHTGQWFGEVGTQFNKKMYERCELERMLGLDPGRKTAVVFPHMFWDASFFYGIDLFRDYKDWFVRTMQAAAANTSLNWVVKIHPANVVKNLRDGVRGEVSEQTVLREALGELPSHVKLIEAGSDISTFSLFPAMDYCLTVRGTIGVEAASFGVRVLTAGTGRYDHLGFTLDSEGASEYLERIRGLHEVAPMTAEERELAERYAYGVFVARPLEAKSFRLEYAKDESATPRVGIELRSMQELMEAADLAALAEWALDGRAEDFLGRPLAS